MTHLHPEGGVMLIKAVEYPPEPRRVSQAMTPLLVLLALIPTALTAQPILAGVEVYGARKIGKEKILRLVGASAGAPLPKSKGEIEEKLETLDGIVNARVEAFCCEQGRPILYIGVEERGRRRLPVQGLAGKGNRAAQGDQLRLGGLHRSPGPRLRRRRRG